MIFVYIIPCISFFVWWTIFEKWVFLLVTFEAHAKLRLCCTDVNIYFDSFKDIPHKTESEFEKRLGKWKVWTDRHDLLWVQFMQLLFGLLCSFIYRVSQEERTKLREDVPYVKLYRYNPKHVYPKLNGYGDNGKWSLKLWQLLHTYWLPNSY